LSQGVGPVLIVNASPSIPSRTAALVGHVSQELSRAGMEVRQLTLRTLPAEGLLQGKADAPGIREAVAEVARAGGVVLATPIYQAAYSGLLKVFLDLLPQFALADKTVLPLATGGSLAHVLAIDYALRPVLSALGARHVVAGFFLLDRQIEAGGGDVILDAETAERLRLAINAFVDSVIRHAR
jgi:FMN reductase